MPVNHFNLNSFNETDYGWQVPIGGLINLRKDSLNRQTSTDYLQAQENFLVEQMETLEVLLRVNGRLVTGLEKVFTKLHIAYFFFFKLNTNSCNQFTTYLLHSASLIHIKHQKAYQFWEFACLDIFLILFFVILVLYDSNLNLI